MLTSDSGREQQAQHYGGDGWRLLDAIFATTSPIWLRQIPAVETLRRVWVQQYYCCNGRLRWRTKNDVIKIKFSSSACSVCPSLTFCTQSKRQRRTVTIRPEQQYKA